MYDDLSSSDEALIVQLAGCSLATTSKKDNWVDDQGGLPMYICEIARSIKKTGKTTSQAIAIAVSRVKKWAAGGEGVEADTVAKATKALAQWEAMKAKAKAKDVKMSSTDDDSLVLAPVKLSGSLGRMQVALSRDNGPGREVASAKGVARYKKPLGTPLGQGQTSKAGQLARTGTAKGPGDFLARLKAASNPEAKAASDTQESKNQQIRDLTAAINKIFPAKDGGQHPNFSLTREELEARLKQNRDAGPEALNAKVIEAYEKLLELMDLKSVS